MKGHLEIFEHRLKAMVAKLPGRDPMYQCQAVLLP